MCLTETKCDNIDNEIISFKSYLMTKKNKLEDINMGEFHGITIFINEFIAQRCIIIHDLSSESI